MIMMDRLCGQGKVGDPVRSSLLSGFTQSSRCTHHVFDRERKKHRSKIVGYDFNFDLF